LNFSEIKHALLLQYIFSSDIPKLKYLSSFLKEVMRLHTPVPIVNRTLEEPVVVDGEELPAGIMVDLCMYHTHNHPDVWQNSTVSFISID
jgi:cytochrome P450